MSRHHLRGRPFQYVEWVLDVPLRHSFVTVAHNLEDFAT